MKRLAIYNLIALSISIPALAFAQPDPALDRAAFESAANRDWKPVFLDSGTGDWKKSWFLDGEIGTVANTPEGMVLTAGPEFKNDAHHMVLWTERTFSGDLKIDYEYTRLDDETRCVTILYIQATGNGIAPFSEDISEWSELRQVPAMRTYFNNMNTYHISYAAFPNDEDTTSYIRARRYMPDGTGLSGTELLPDYFPEGLFKMGVPHKITVIKKDREILMRIQNPEQVYYCHMTNPDMPVINSGRIGLPHMYTRSACYRNFQVSVPE